MDTIVCLEAGPEEQCYTMSPKVNVQWDSNVIYCGFKAAYKVTLTGVDEHAMVQAFCRTREGELLDESALHIRSTFYMDNVLIPFNVVAGTDIYIEIRLPEYGVMYKSDCKPVRNSFSLRTSTGLITTRQKQNCWHILTNVIFNIFKT